MGVTSHQGKRESCLQEEVAQVAGWPGAVRYARCGAPKQNELSFEGYSEKATGELIDTETVTISSEGGRWKRAEGDLAGGLPYHRHGLVVVAPSKHGGILWHARATLLRSNPLVSTASCTS